MAVERAFFENLDTGERVEVQFNPAELHFSKSIQLAEIAIPGLDSPVIQYIRGASETIQVELFFDTTETGMGDNARSVTDKVDAFYHLVKQNQDTHAPPRCRFSWGQPSSGPAPAANLEPATEASHAPFWFTCIVESVDRRFVLFSPQGTPLRARVTVGMREYKTVEQMVAYLHSADHTQWHPLKRRERLDQISADVYDTPSEWRRIANENAIEDPLRMSPGTILRIPAVRPVSAIRRPR